MNLGDARADAFARTGELMASLLTEERKLGPRLPIVNPPIWEFGHVAWFQEWWCLRHRLGRAPLRADADALWDSAKVAHETRWDLRHPTPGDVAKYVILVNLRVAMDLAEVVDSGPTPESYFHWLALFHEDMHGEAFLYTHQTHGYPAPLRSALPGTLRERLLPRFPSLGGDGADALDAPGGGPLPGDVEVPGGTFLLGAACDEPFVFDNERDAHPVTLRPFRIARAPVTQAEFAEFVEAGGYRRPELWSEAGRAWRAEAGAEHPVSWRREPTGRWLRRHFDRWVPLEEHRPVIHVNWFEADAWCRWRGRRLPTEAEWEMAAACGHATAGPDGLLAKRRFPWGDDPPEARHAHLDGRYLACADVAAYPAGDSPSGCRQMIGNVWEWTASDFLPYPGFRPGPYREYSEPWFGNHKVLRGGCFATRARLLRNSWRNFYTPDRRDVWCGFRTASTA